MNRFSGFREQTTFKAPKKNRLAGLREQAAVLDKPKAYEAPTDYLRTKEVPEVLSEIEKRKPMGFVESAVEEFTQPAKGAQYIPGIGGIVGTAENLLYLDAANRLSKGYDYSKPIRPEQLMPGAMGIRSARYATREKDAKIIEGLILRTQKQQERGYTFGGKVAKGVMILPTWMAEFAMTGGLASLGNKAAQEAGEKLIKNYAKTKVGRLALKTAGWTGGAITRTTLGLAPRVTEEITRRQVGVQILGAEKENWATSIAKGWGNIFIEAASEEAGQAISGRLVGELRSLPFGKKFLGSLSSKWAKIAPENTTTKFWKKIFTKGGYSNIIGEVGEERLATLMHSIANTESFGVKPTGNKVVDLANRLKAGIEQDIKNFPVEATVLSIPGATRFTLGKLTGRQERLPRAEQVRKELIQDYLAKVEKEGLRKPTEKAITTPTEAIPVPEQAIQPRTTDKGVELPQKAGEVKPEAVEAIRIEREGPEDTKRLKTVVEEILEGIKVGDTFSDHRGEKWEITGLGSTAGGGLGIVAETPTGKKTTFTPSFIRGQLAQPVAKEAEPATAKEIAGQAPKMTEDEFVAATERWYTQPEARRVHKKLVKEALKEPAPKGIEILSKKTVLPKKMDYIAIELATGQIYFDRKVTTHAEIANKLGLDINEIKTAGWITPQGYSKSISEAKLLAEAKGEKQPKTALEMEQQAWKMTLDDYFDLHKKLFPGRMGAVILRYHKDYVKDAVSEGKPVPRAVLEEYKSETWAQEALKKDVRDEMKVFFADLYKNKYKIAVPKITKGKDGIWIRTTGIRELPTKAGIFIEVDDWRKNKKFYKTFLEDADDRVIHAQEALKEPAKVEGKAEQVKPKGIGKVGFPGKVVGGEMPKTLEPAARKPVTAEQIITHLSKALKVPYASMATHRPRMAAGWYEIKPRGIRQIDVRDLDTAAHEVGHHIDHYFKIRQAGISKIGRRTWKMPEGTAKGTAAELTKLGKMLYGTRKPKGGYRSEGIAEYVRGYLTGHLDVEKEAPKFHKWFIKDYLPNNPEVAQALEKSRELLTDYRLQGAEARIENQISIKEIKGSLKDRIKAANLWIQQMFVDEFMPLRKGMEEAEIKRKELKPTEDPYELAVYFTQKEGARARQMVLFGTIDLWGNKTGKGLKEIMKPIADQNAVRQFTHFVVAARSLNLLKRGINPGISKEDAQYVYDLYKDNEGWQETAKEITEWNHRVLNYLSQAGALPKETADNMIKANPIYVPFLRAFAKGEKRFGGGGAGAGLITTKKGVFAIKGSGREIIDPFESMITQTRRMIAIAHKSVIARSLANLEARHRGLAGLIWKVPAPKKATTFRAEQAIKQLQKMGVEVTGEGLPEPGEMMEGRPTVYDALMTVYGNSPIYLGKENIIAIVQDGKKTWYEVSPDMYKLLQGLDKFYMPRFLDVVFGKAGRAMRLGATGLNASFGLVKNPIRDMQDTIFKGTHARGPGATVKGVAKDLSRLGLAKSIGIEPSKAAEAFVAQGGQISGFIGQDRKSLQHLKGEMLASSIGRYSIHTVKHPIDAIREVFGVSESGPRIQEYEKALEYAEKKYGKGSPNAKVYAFNKAQDQTINFSRHGVIGKWLNQMIPFWNANMQDISKVNRTFRERGKEATAYAIVFLTLPALGLWWYNKDEEWYKELPAYEKANYLHIKIPGKDTILRIPVPFLVGHIFQGFPVTVVDALYKADKTRVKEFFKEVLEADVYSLVEWPAIISPVIDVLRNKDWAGRPIVPKSVEGKLPSDQYKEYTTEFAKSIGKVFNMSPAKIEHLMNSWSGGLYRRIAGIPEIAKKEELTAVDMPIIGKLFVRDPYAPKATIERFYERCDLLDRKFQSEKITRAEKIERLKLNWRRRKLTPIWKQLQTTKKIDNRKILYKRIEKRIKGTPRGDLI